MCSIMTFLMQDIFGGKVYGILSFEELDMENIFDRIWAFASLLHDSNGNIELKNSMVLGLLDSIFSCFKLTISHSF